ncbi:MAG TPA: DUF4118 domain-containing protein [Xanthobacteraceae bacterium]|jgi:hypothetical protein
MNREFIGQLRYLVTLWIAGSMALAFVTWACFELGLNFATTALFYLIVIVLPSLLDSFISSAVFSVVAVGCLNFFFTKPLFSFDVESPQGRGGAGRVRDRLVRRHQPGAAPARAERAPPRAGPAARSQPRRDFRPRRR